MRVYVLDHLALTAGLAGGGGEHDRRELSRLLHGALERGPRLAVPSLCLAEAAAVRPAISGHLAALLADGPVGAIEIVGLTRSPQLDALRSTFPELDWACAHAVVHALTAGAPVVTTRLAPYVGVPIDVMLL